MEEGLLYRFGVWLDQGLNLFVKLSDGWGSPDEMLSARAWRLRVGYPRLVKIIDGLFFWDADHCRECYEIELRRRQLPSEYREAKSNVFAIENSSPES